MSDAAIRDHRRHLSTVCSPAPPRPDWRSAAHRQLGSPRAEVTSERHRRALSGADATRARWVRRTGGRGGKGARGLGAVRTANAFCPTAAAAMETASGPQEKYQLITRNLQVLGCGPGLGPVLRGWGGPGPGRGDRRAPLSRRAVPGRAVPCLAAGPRLGAWCPPQPGCSRVSLTGGAG